MVDALGQDNEVLHAMFTKFMAAYEMDRKADREEMKRLRKQDREEMDRFRADVMEELLKNNLHL